MAKKELPKGLKKEKKTEHVAFLATKSQKDKLDAYCSEEGVDSSSVLRIALDEFLEKYSE
ncbi:Arc-like repressor [Thiohalocapsa phage LS06-2018-MD03]|nr:Arc-like repressor [Thiohalocapsa phage LS06-2018-MD03]